VEGPSDRVKSASDQKTAVLRQGRQNRGMKEIVLKKVCIRKLQAERGKSADKPEPIHSSIVRRKNPKKKARSRPTI
jgi:hypothetical protein